MGYKGVSGEKKIHQFSKNVIELHVLQRKEKYTPVF
jgi:hypothetical protein